MGSLRQKRPRLGLDPIAYKELWLEVLHRDGWRCQQCGKSDHLEVHHKESRGRLGDDAEWNLITLCSECHLKTHRYTDSTR